MLIINLNQDKSKINNYLSTTLLKNIEENLKNWKKNILYLNKRWSYNSLICPKCSKVFKCKNCDCSLSIHSQNMICHICWAWEKILEKCDNCNWENLEKVWVWTEQIEFALKNTFKNSKIFRIDTDIVKNKSEKQKALEQLKDAEIIIWTKMITTGFDFENVGLIWVILFEQELIWNKYNVEENLYSNITQLLWRWWRKWEKTEFLIQTFIPENDLIKQITSGNYKDFFLKSLSERKLFSYPPFKEFVILEYRNKDKQKAFNYTKSLYEKLLCHSELDSESLKNPEIIFSENSFKKYNQYYFKIILKWENLREFLNCIKSEIFREKNLSVIFE